MKKKVIFASTVAFALIFGIVTGAFAATNLEKITAYLNKDISFLVGNKSWTAKDPNGKPLYPLTYNGSTYLPVRALGEALGVPIDWVDETKTVLVNSDRPATEKPTSNNSVSTKQLKTVKEIQDYLDSNYKTKSPLKTDLAEINFSFKVTENTSKFEEYDIQIEFDYDLLTIEKWIFDNENSISAANVKKASNTENTIKSFIESFAKDIVAKVPEKKIRGQSEKTYYTYPNIQEDLNVVTRNVWVNYDFIDPDSYFADHFGPLAEYSDTVISKYQWIGNPY